jgi:hypothetical protein
MRAVKVRSYMAEESSLAELRESVERHIAALEAQGVYDPRRVEFYSRIGPRREPTPEERAQQELKRKLEARFMFLNDFRDRLDDDPALLHFVDSIISNHVQAAEQRHRDRLHAALQEQASKYEAMLHQQQADSKVAERRQNTYSLSLTVVSSVAALIAGWLLSAISPVSALAHLLPH